MSKKIFLGHDNILEFVTNDRDTIATLDGNTGTFDLAGIFNGVLNEPVTPTDGTLNITGDLEPTGKIITNKLQIAIPGPMEIRNTLGTTVLFIDDFGDISPDNTFQDGFYTQPGSASLFADNANGEVLVNSSGISLRSSVADSALAVAHILDTYPNALIVGGAKLLSIRNGGVDWLTFSADSDPRLVMHGFGTIGGSPGGGITINSSQSFQSYIDLYDDATGIEIHSIGPLKITNPQHVDFNDINSGTNTYLRIFGTNATSGTIKGSGTGAYLHLQNDTNTAFLDLAGDGTITFESTTANGFDINSAGGLNITITGAGNGFDLTIEDGIAGIVFTTASEFVVTNGDVEVETIGTGFILKSPNGTRYRITVDNAGVLGTTPA